LEKIPSDHYLISPLFVNSSKKIGKGFPPDAQIGCVTGKCKVGESEEEAAKREVAEELGIIVKTMEKIHEGPCTYFQVPATSVIPYDSNEDYFFSEERKEDKPRKVGVVIHGSLSEVKSLTSKLVTVYNRHLPTADLVLGVVMMPRDFALRVAVNYPPPAWGTVTQKKVLAFKDP
jgi:predicted NUDIX family NTP pyrophosphohydrolase